MFWLPANAFLIGLEPPLVVEFFSLLSFFFFFVFWGGGAWVGGGREEVTWNILKFVEYILFALGLMKVALDFNF